MQHWSPVRLVWQNSGIYLATKDQLVSTWYTYSLTMKCPWRNTELEANIEGRKVTSIHACRKFLHDGDQRRVCAGHEDRQQQRALIGRRLRGVLGSVQHQGVLHFGRSTLQKDLVHAVCAIISASSLPYIIAGEQDAGARGKMEGTLTRGGQCGARASRDTVAGAVCIWRRNGATVDREGTLCGYFWPRETVGLEASCYI